MHFSFLKVLHQHPAVQAAQVIGVPDARLGEEIAACLQIKQGHTPPSLDEIRTFCQVFPLIHLSSSSFNIHFDCKANLAQYSY